MKMKFGKKTPKNWIEMHEFEDVVNEEKMQFMMKNKWKFKYWFSFQLYLKLRLLPLFFEAFNGKFRVSVSKRIVWMWKSSFCVCWIQSIFCEIEKHVNVMKLKPLASLKKSNRLTFSLNNLNWLFDIFTWFNVTIRGFPSFSLTSLII